MHYAYTAIFRIIKKETKTKQDIILVWIRQWLQ